MEVAETIRNAIEEYRFEWQDAFTSVRCSIGVVMVTHERDIITWVTRVVTLADGQIVNNTANGASALAAQQEVAHA